MLAMFELGLYQVIYMYMYALDMIYSPSKYHNLANITTNTPGTLKLMTIIWWTYTYAIFIHWCKAHLPNSTKPTFIVSLFLSPSSSVLSMHVCRYKIYRICIQHTHPIQTNLNVLFSELLIRHAPTRQPLYTFRFLLRYNALVIIMEHIP